MDTLRKRVGTRLYKVIGKKISKANAYNIIIMHLEILITRFKFKI